MAGLVLKYSSGIPQGYLRVFEGSLEVDVHPGQALVTAAINAGAGVADAIARDFLPYINGKPEIKFDQARFTLDEGFVGPNGKTMLPYKVYVRLTD